MNGISLHVQEGKTLGIIGESGCGKSVSVLSILKLLPEPPAIVAADSIRFRGQDLTNAPREEMRKIRGNQIAMIFQEPMTSFNPVFTIGLQIMEPLQLHLGMSTREARERAKELLKLVGIPDAQRRLSEYPHQFSGGMRQRAMIAMALACNPSLLIADEPTTALDVTIQAQIVELVKRLRDQFGMAVIWISHDLGVVAGLADRVVVMYAGYLVEEATIEQIYHSPRHPYTSALLRSLPRIDEPRGAQLASIEGLPPELFDLPTGCPFLPRCEFVKEICKQNLPNLEKITDEHRIACWVDIITGELR